MANRTLLPFTRELKEQGFRRIDSGKNPLCYKKQMIGRKIDVQLWRDGGHRVSHMLQTCPYGICKLKPPKPELGVNPDCQAFGCQCGMSNTRPTDFKTVDEMLGAILHEMTRKDHPKPIENPGMVLIV